MALDTVFLAAGLGGVLGWLARVLASEPNRHTHERHLIDAYRQGWRACETYWVRRAARELEGYPGPDDMSRDLGEEG